MSDLGIPGLEDVEEVARGGFGVVYRARQPAFGRVVAVKVLTGADASVEARERFERECQAMGALSGHPNIVTVYDQGTTREGRSYLVMDFMPGGSLTDVLARRGGPVPWPEVCQIGVKLCGGLDAAHEARVLHRDLKPDNVLVSAYGEPKLADFGIARMQGAVETRTGVVTASVAHAPPEVLAGERPSVASDVYSLGSTLFALVWGSPPFMRPTDESLVPVYARITTEPPPDLRPMGVPDPVCRVLEQALAKDPAQRHRSAAELGRALQAAQVATGLQPTELVLVAREVLDGAAPPPVERTGPPGPPAWTPPARPVAPGAPGGPPGAAVPSGLPPSAPSAVPGPVGPPPGPPARQGRGALVAAVVVVALALAAVGALVALGGGDDDEAGADGTTTTAPEAAAPGTTAPDPTSGTPTTGTPATEPDGTTTSSLVDEPLVPLEDILAGECFSRPEGTDGPPLDAALAECSTAHDYEVVLNTDLALGPDEPYPGQDAAFDLAQGQCIAGYESFTGVVYDFSQWQLDFLYPTEARWDAGLHAVVCLVSRQDGRPVTGSIAG